MLKLKLQSFGHLMWRADSLEKTLMLGKIEGQRRRGRQRMRWLDGITTSVYMSLSWWWTRRPGMGSQRVRRDPATELNWLKGSLEKSSTEMLHLSLKSSACPLGLKLHRKGHDGTASDPARLPPGQVQAAGLRPLPSSSPRECHALAVPGASPSRRCRACLPYFILLYLYFVLFPFVSPSPDIQAPFPLLTEAPGS